MLGLDRVHCAKKIYTKKEIQKKKSSHLSIYIIFYHCVITVYCVLFCSSAYCCDSLLLASMLIPMACSSSAWVVITLLTYVVRVLVLPRKVVIISFRRFRFYYEIYIHVLLIGFLKKHENLLIQAFMMLCQTTTFGKLLHILMRST